MSGAVKWRLVAYSVAIVVALGWGYWRTRTPAPIEVRVIGEGVVEVGGRTMDLTQLGPYVVQRTGSQPAREVRVIVDARSPSTVLIPVLDVLDRSGVDNVQVVANP